LAGAIICDEDVTILNCCKFSDVLYMVKILENLNVKANFVDDNLHLNLRDANGFEVGEEYTKKVRSSIFMLGSLLTRFKRAKVAYPGGCNIGTRPIDLHLYGLKQLGAVIKEQNGYIVCDGTNMFSGVVNFTFPSVGATENVIMASVKLKGKTVINNAAKEPEIVDLQNFLNKMGAKIKHLPNHSFEITGNPNLKGVKHHEIIPDPIEAGSFIIMAVACKSEIAVRNVRIDHLEIVLKKLKEFNANFKITLQDKTKNLYIVENIPSIFLKAVSKVQTLPYPGIPTDLQSMFGILATQSNGTTIIQDPMY